MRNRVVFDTRNMLDHQDWKDAGFLVKVLGSGESG
jgi:UDP-N-acetyl-D-mannosaminuronic acid dehydrogenase